jgi:protein-tyrosine-phosphatase/DNA-binding transcriptional ArsR family regulator
MAGQAEIQPPVFLRLASHPVRWRLLRELARTDLRVRELTALTGKPQNAVSYHLARLRAGGLVSMRHSSADRRDSYYTVDLARCGELLTAAADALHPGLRPASKTPGAATRLGPGRPVEVLFLCTGNSSRSQMAEALLAHAGGEQIRVVSAGSHPKAMHPAAVRAMRQYGIDLRGRRSKHMSEFAGRRFDFVITLCDKVREACPEFPGGPEPVHWSIPDPGAEGSDDAFLDTAAGLHARIGFLLGRLAPSPAP